MNTMTRSVQDPPGTPWRADGSHLDLPGWTASLLPPSLPLRPIETHDESISAGERSRNGVRHRVVRLGNARALEGASLTEATHLAYRRLLEGTELRRIFRIWNFIPGIGLRDDADQDRYMRFNAGRFQAFEDHADDARSYPPASGVGHDGTDLVLHLLEADVRVEVVDNPRQIRPERYSSVWGPLPPAFIRSAVVSGLDSGPLLVVSGTASVRGEETMHQGDPDRQLEETIVNLRELMRRVASITGVTGHASGGLDTMLVYVPRAEHLERLRRGITAELADPGSDVEFRVGELCRPDLLVEIEGTRQLEVATG